jgi:hypothetical protein
MKQFFQAKWAVGFTGAVVAALVAGLWLGQGRLKAWYAVRQLAVAPAAQREAQARRLADLGADAVPALVARLGQASPDVCDNLRLGFECLMGHWQNDPVRQGELAQLLVAQFPAFGPAAQRTVIELARGWIPAKDPDPLVGPLTQLVAMAAKSPDEEIRREALQLVGAEPVPGGIDSPYGMACRELVAACLSATERETRLAAMRLAVRNDLALRGHVTPLLGDADSAVRRTAMLAVGAAPDAVSTDELLRWLHDPDDDVRALCETALRGRGLREEHLRLGKYLTDRRVERRLQVLDLLRQTNDLEPSAWLRRLSHDPEPAVRAAAVRAAAEQPQLDLSDRMVQMAQDDASDTVRQLASYYLRARKTRR